MKYKYFPYLFLILLAILCSSLILFKSIIFSFPLTVPSPLFEKQPRIAILVSGRIGGISGGFSMLNVTAKSLMQNVKTGFADHGFVVDVFLYFAEPEFQDVVMELYNPSYYILETEKPVMGLFDSLEGVTNVLNTYKISHNVLYDWVLWTRFDAFFPKSFEISSLNNSLFYVANWCQTSHIETIRDTERFCRQMASFWVDNYGVPDFWFLSSDLLFNEVMLNISIDFRQGSFGSAEPVGPDWNHGNLLDRLKKKKVPIGRYWRHRYDYDFYRQLKNRCWAKSLEWHTSQIVIYRNPAIEFGLEESSNCPSEISYCNCGSSNEFFPSW